MRPALALAALATAALAGCAAPSAQPAPLEPSGFSVDNCGFEVVFDAPPERVVTIKSSTTELLLALGVGDRIVGAAFLDGPVPADLASSAESLPVIADAVPSLEAVLAVEPDLVFAGWESSFSADGVGERESLEALGVHTYVAPSACKAAGYQPDPLTLDDVFAHISEAGAIFDAADAAEALIAEQRAALDALPEIATDDAPTALWYSSGSDVPFVGGGIGAPQLIMSSIGLENIASGIDDTWASFSWEAVIDADPDVIVLVDSAWNTAENKIAVLEGNPGTARLTAVREGRYLVIDFAATEAGVRTVPAILDLAGQLDALE